MITIAFIIFFFLLGLFSQRVIKRPDTVTKWLNTYIIYVALPSIILVKIPGLEFNALMLIPVGFAWFWALVGGLLMLLLARMLSIPRPIEGAAVLLTILGNVSFLGYPMIQAFFNDEVLSYGIFYDQLGCFLILSTVGLILIALYAPAESGQRISATSILIRVFTFPPFVALIVASALPVRPITDLILPLLNLIGMSLMPLALIVIGLQFKPQLLPEHKLPLTLSIGLKMVVAPVMAYFFTKAISDDPIVLYATTFEAAMPSMITPGILAMQAGLSPRFCATLLGYSTLFSFIWLPIVAYAVQIL